MIDLGEADVVITGGAEANIIPISRGGDGEHEGALHPQRRAGEAPAARSTATATASSTARARRRSSSRRWSTHERRGARIYAELGGGAITSDAYHITAPDPSGDAASRAITQRDEGVRPRTRKTSTCIVAHGTGTPLNDAAETIAIKRALGEHAYGVAVTGAEVDGRAPARRGGRCVRPRGRAGDRPRRRPADDQPRDAGPGVRSGLRAARRRARRSRAWRSSTASASAGRTASRRSSAIRRTGSDDARPDDSPRHNCFGCGERNPEGLHIEFEIDGLKVTGGSRRARRTRGSRTWRTAASRRRRWTRRWAGRCTPPAPGR